MSSDNCAALVAEDCCAITGFGSCCHQCHGRNWPPPPGYPWICIVIDCMYINCMYIIAYLSYNSRLCINHNIAIAMIDCTYLPISFISYLSSNGRFHSVVDKSCLGGSRLAAHLWFVFDVLFLEGVGLTADGSINQVPKN